MENQNFVPIMPEMQNKQPAKQANITDILLIVFIGYFFISIFAAVLFVHYTNTNVFRLSQTIAEATNLRQKNSLDIPVYFPKGNLTALRTSILENEYGGKVVAVDESLASKSADLQASIGISLIDGSVFTYYITKKEFSRLAFVDDVKFTEEYRTLNGLKAGDRIGIKETINLKRPPADSKTRIEVIRY